MKGRALSLEKKRYLLHIYLTNGYTAAKPLAIKLGVSPRIISKYARAAGHKGRRGRESGIWKGIGSRYVADAALWQRAIERGPVVI